MPGVLSQRDLVDEAGWRFPGKDSMKKFRKKLRAELGKKLKAASSVVGKALTKCGGNILGIVANPAALAGAAECVLGAANQVAADARKVATGAKQIFADAKEGAAHVKEEAQEGIKQVQDRVSRDVTQAAAEVIDKADEFKKRISRGQLSASAALDALAKTAMGAEVKTTVTVVSQTGELKNKLASTVMKEVAVVGRDAKMMS